jgi:hypothetical protein
MTSGGTILPALAGHLNFVIWIRDDGWLRLRGIYRINVTIRYKVRRGERFVESKKFMKELGGLVFPKHGLHGNFWFFKNLIFSLTGGI